MTPPIPSRIKTERFRSCAALFCTLLVLLGAVGCDRVIDAPGRHDGASWSDKSRFSKSRPPFDLDQPANQTWNSAAVTNFDSKGVETWTDVRARRTSDPNPWSADFGEPKDLDGGESASPQTVSSSDNLFHDPQLQPAAADVPIEPKQSDILADSPPHDSLPEKEDDSVLFPGGKLGEIRSFEKWDISETAMDSLSRIGAPAVPALIQRLQHPEAACRAQTALILARIGPEAAEAVPALQQALRDTDPDVRKAAARALGQIGPDAAASVNSLLELMEDSPPPANPSLPDTPDPTYYR